MRQIINVIDGLNERIGKVVCWLALAMVVVQFTVVVLRYVFGVSFLWMQESIVYMHGFLFMLAAAYTLKHDGHVRADIFYREALPRKKARVNLFGSVFFLLPMCAVILYTAYPYVYQSWSILEGSNEASGIQGRYLQKTAIMVFAVLVAAQGIVMICRSIIAIKGDKAELEELSHEEDLEIADALARAQALKEQEGAN